MTVKIYDTTLRDGTQGEGINFSLEDKVRIAKKLDEFGIHYIEGGWPGSNPKDIGFFKRMQSVKLKNSKLAAFGSTRRAKSKAEKDPNILALIESKTPVVTIFGKSWDFQVTDALRTTLEENLAMIEDSVSYLKSQNLEVLYDAEHFFDGYKSNPEYALETIKAAAKAGAETVILCDTNGGSLTDEIYEITKKAKKALGKTPVGIHTHNDSGIAVANGLAAVQAGAVHAQGTTNGFGERCGNMDICVFIANCSLKLKKKTIPEESVKNITALSQYVYEMGNLVPDHRQPFVGKSAFAHKGGIHVSAVQRDTRTYEHVKPEDVGNVRRILVSELSGRSNINHVAEEIGIDLKDYPEQSARILEKIKTNENAGYFYEAANASLEILMRKELGFYKSFFKLERYRVLIEDTGKKVYNEATVRLKVGKNKYFVAAEGDGPVHALDTALRKALEKEYPKLKDMHLVDYKVRVLNAEEATAAQVRVLIVSHVGAKEWCTVGVSENIIEASWAALVDSIEYALLRD